MGGLLPVIVWLGGQWLGGGNSRRVTNLLDVFIEMTWQGMVKAGLRRIIWMTI